MSLHSRITKTADRLISKYGNTVLLEKVSTDNVYNPQTGSYGNETSTQYSKKANNLKVTTESLTSSGIPDNEWGNISSIYTLVNDTDIINIDDTWTIDNLHIKKIIRTTLQDDVILINIYAG